MENTDVNSEVWNYLQILRILNNVLKPNLDQMYGLEIYNILAISLLYMAVTYRHWGQEGI
jgi:hypothetical protein